MKLIAHRGFSKTHPENTIPAFRAAIENNARAIEFDVQMTSDNEIVVIHDFELGRTNEGKGLVINSSLEYLKSLDAGSWFSEDFKDTRIPALKEVLEIIPDNIMINIEIKQLAIDKRNVAEKVYGIVKDMGYLPSVIFSSSNHRTLMQLQDAGASRLGLLLASKIIEPWKYLDLTGLKCISLHQNLAYVDKDFIEEAHEHGYMVFAYTVNDPDYARIFQSHGIDGIFTDNLDIIKK